MLLNDICWKFANFRTKLGHILANCGSDSGACVFIENSLQWRNDHVFAGQELSSLCCVCRLLLRILFKREMAAPDGEFLL